MNLQVSRFRVSGFVLQPFGAAGNSAFHMGTFSMDMSLYPAGLTTTPSEFYTDHYQISTLHLKLP